MKTIDRTGTAKVTLPSDTEILITREFDAPAELVFDVWTRPEHVRNWWGWESDPMTVCEVDLRVGGKWHYVSVNEELGEIDFYGEFKEIDRPRRLVSTEIFAPYPDSATLNTLTLEERDGITIMRVLVQCETTETRDAIIASGMEGGLQHGLDRIDEILAGELEESV
ncbi:MAG TPA: SRPBCC family protein [Acidimicrobiia bacterium]|nr:SRPBCC family protein [Acidimicrobiia bacterium]